MDLLVHVTFSSAQISLPRANSTTVSDDHRQNDQNHDISYGIYSQHVCLFFKSDKEKLLHFYDSVKSVLFSFSRFIWCSIECSRLYNNSYLSFFIQNSTKLYFLNRLPVGNTAGCYWQRRVMSPIHLARGRQITLIARIFIISRFSDLQSSSILPRLPFSQSI